MLITNRGTLLAILTAALLPVLARAQDEPLDRLLRRIEALERRASDLEGRVRDLEALTRPAPSRQGAASATKWRDLQNWRRLRHGMTMEDVRTLLGEPEKVDAGPVLTYWYWAYPGGANVLFDTRAGKVSGWSEPSS